MLPSILARQYQEGLIDYIDTTFPMTNSVFKGSLKKMLETKDAVFHEPYVAVRLPFRVYEEEDNNFKSIHQSYSPYVHQKKAFDRLTGEDGRSTLVATGTGSGKTECFLYPILEYCYQHRGEKGIKALIIYPMNALASDQAKRIAEQVDGSSELKNAGVRVGMYVGGVEATSAKMMMPDHVITDKATLLASPPDILMTNYKMLDYLLVRPKDAELWKNNQPDTLKYIAVDELHTFDGAQGTDLACLLRRLKARLNILSGQICCIGTSATMGSRDSADNIRQYASEVFGEEFEEDAIITEDRLSPREFFDGYSIDDYKMPSKREAELLNELSKGEDEEEYLRTAVSAWFDSDFNVSDIMSDDTRVKIGQHLMAHNFTQSLIYEAKGSYVQTEAIAESLNKRFPEFNELGKENVSAIIDAIYALISHARIRTANGAIRPFLNVQVQLWMRELRRLVAKVSDSDITYALAGDLNEQQAKHYLPVVNCRDCGQTGWASLEDNGSVELRDLNTFYNMFFNCDSKVRLIFPYKKDEHAQINSLPFKLCPDCMEISFAEGSDLCANGHPTIPVLIPDLKTSGHGRGKSFECPFCGSRGGLSIMGLRSATAISAGVSELYASKFNDDKKLLAFTDNVQDAAHHAGFYNSRTWRFGLRTAITRFGQLENKEYTLDEFIHKCSAYWKNYMGNEDFVANFIPTGLTWMRAYNQMVDNGYLKDDEDANYLINAVSERMRYEILLEYGITARIGRSLEKTNSSVLSFDIEDVVSRVAERIPNETGLLHGADRDVYYKLVFGLLYQMKLNGAFSYYAYNQFIQQGGSDYLISSKYRKWMPGPRKGRNVPKFVAINKSGKKLGYFDEPNNRSWYGKWVDKYLPVMHAESDSFDINKIILDELVNTGLLVKPESQEGVEVFAINTEKCTVSQDVYQLACDECGCQMATSPLNSHHFVGACCIRKECSGHMRHVDVEGPDFYGKLYSQGEMIRIVAKEHTGLLERDDREELERTFKKSKENKKPWDANLLSCTPTLEMGIDIGDLSTVILSSIPPTQSNYAQRAGRGGRKDGNALTIAVANAKPHDLYFYEDPMEMIAGSVKPPKVFLKASAVLARQFVAYCMDCWVKTGNAVMPKDVGACLAKLDDTATDRFPNNFMQYVQTNLTKLVRTFINTFSANPGGTTGGLDENAIADIKRFAMGDSSTEESMAFKIYHEFRELKAQRQAIQDNLKELKKLQKELEAKPQDSSYDEQLKEINAELSAWSKVVYGINSKDVFGFLADSGLLPNYAFPEAGIVLKAVITRSDNDPEHEGKKKYESRTYEYSRSASAAISEFAPMNSFYAGGHKLTIDQVDVNTAKSEPWRLCPNCNHAEINNAGNVSATCPKCGSAGWSDQGQVRNMFKVSMVYSNMKEEESLIGDDTDDRASVYFDKEMLVEVDEDKDVIQAFQMDNDEFSFGYEFVKKATMREINFGESDMVGEKVTVAGREGVRKGFTICKHCGKIQVEHEQPKHNRFCKVIKDNTGLQMSDYEECLFLYREFNTEALRILIPATTMDATGVRQESFVAAFMLGMESYFGNVDHLNATVSEVPVPDADYRKQYLVIYDTVPGGTGYLKQLMNDENGIEDVLQRALDIMEHCSCNDDPQKDGCYKCLYAYRQSRHIGEISRRTATNLVKAILSGRDNKKEIKKLANVDANHLFDSELERKFIGAFERLSTADRPIKIHKQLVNDKEGYSLQVGESLWSIEPQVDFDVSTGIAVHSKPDFVIRAKRTTGNQKPIAVFTDGYQFHNNIVEKDTKKRMAIMLSGKYRVWSLTWNDVENIYKDKGDYMTPTLVPDKMPRGAMYTATINQLNVGGIRPAKQNAFELLVEYLANPKAEELFSSHAKAYAMAIVDNNALSNQILFGEWENGWKSILTAINSTDEPDKFGTAFAGKWKPRVELGNVEVFAEVGLTDMQVNGMKATFNIGAIINDDVDTRTDKFQQDWNGFWHFANVMQFTDSAYFLSSVGMKTAIYTALGSIIADTDTPANVQSTAIVIDKKWKTYIDEEYFIDDIARTCATEMMNAGAPAPSSIGYELEDSNGAGIAEAEMAWEDYKVVWLLPEQEDYADTFKSHGWTVIYSYEKINVDVFGGTADE